MNINIQINERGKVSTPFTNYIGHNEENDYTSLSFDLPESLQTDFGYILDMEFPDGEKAYDAIDLNTPYVINSAILEYDSVIFQLVGGKDNDIVWKSDQWTMKVKPSINAESEFNPEEHIDVLLSIQERITEVSQLVNSEGAIVAIPFDEYFETIEDRDNYYITHPELLIDGHLCGVLVQPVTEPITYTINIYHEDTQNWSDSVAIARGPIGEQGETGDRGVPGLSPYINNETGTWWQWDEQNPPVAYDTGHQAKGDPGQNAVAGIQYFGAWSETKQYYVVDTLNNGWTDSVIGSDGNRYIAIADSIGVDPTTDTTNAKWSLMVAQGAPGVNGTSGYSPRIQDSSWWAFNDTTKQWYDTGVSAQNAVVVVNTFPSPQAAIVGVLYVTEAGVARTILADHSMWVQISGGGGGGSVGSTTWSDITGRLPNNFFIPAATVTGAVTLNLIGLDDQNRAHIGGELVQGVVLQGATKPVWVDGSNVSHNIAFEDSVILKDTSRIDGTHDIQRINTQLEFEDNPELFPQTLISAVNPDDPEHEITGGDAIIQRTVKYTGDNDEIETYLTIFGDYDTHTQFKTYGNDPEFGGHMTYEVYNDDGTIRTRIIPNSDDVLDGTSGRELYINPQYDGIIVSNGSQESPFVSWAQAQAHLQITPSIWDGWTIHIVGDLNEAITIPGSSGGKVIGEGATANINGIVISKDAGDCEFENLTVDGDISVINASVTRDGTNYNCSLVFRYVNISGNLSILDPYSGQNYYTYNVTYKTIGSGYKVGDTLQGGDAVWFVREVDNNGGITRIRRAIMSGTEEITDTTLTFDNINSNGSGFTVGITSTLHNPTTNNYSQRTIEFDGCDFSGQNNTINGKITQGISVRGCVNNPSDNYLSYTYNDFGQKIHSYPLWNINATNTWVNFISTRSVSVSQTDGESIYSANTSIVPTTRGVPNYALNISGGYLMLNELTARNKGADRDSRGDLYGVSVQNCLAVYGIMEYARDFSIFSNVSVRKPYGIPDTMIYDLQTRPGYTPSQHASDMQNIWRIHFTMESGGSGYVIGDVITLTGSANTYQVKVTRIDNNGTILSNGYGYLPRMGAYTGDETLIDPNITPTTTNHGTGASFFIQHLPWAIEKQFNGLSDEQIRQGAILEEDKWLYRMPVVLDDDGNYVSGGMLIAMSVQFDELHLRFFGKGGIPHNTINYSGGITQDTYEFDDVDWVVVGNVYFTLQEGHLGKHSVVSVDENNKTVTFDSAFEIVQDVGSYIIWDQYAVNPQVNWLQNINSNLIYEFDFGSMASGGIENIATIPNPPEGKAGFTITYLAGNPPEPVTAEILFDIPVVTAGNGINYVNNVISVTIQTGSGLAVTSSGVGVDGTHVIPLITDHNTVINRIDATNSRILGTSENLVTERAVRYSQASINGARTTDSVSVYAPTQAGEAGQILKSTGGTPAWSSSLSTASVSKTTVVTGITNNTAATTGATSGGTPNGTVSLTQTSTASGSTTPGAGGSTTPGSTGAPSATTTVVTAVPATANATPTFTGSALGTHTHTVDPASTTSGAPSATTTVATYSLSGTTLTFSTTTVGSSSHTHATDIGSTTTSAVSAGTPAGTVSAHSHAQGTLTTAVVGSGTHTHASAAHTHTGAAHTHNYDKATAASFTGSALGTHTHTYNSASASGTNANVLTSTETISQVVTGV